VLARRLVNRANDRGRTNVPEAALVTYWLSVQPHSIIHIYLYAGSAADCWQKLDDLNNAVSGVGLIPWGEWVQQVERAGAEFDMEVF
jgi:hypothetical protein